MKIGILDSGLGGLIVLKELINHHKTTHYLYYGDYQHAPYGNKNDMQLQSYYRAAMSFFLANHCDFVIVACNTLSTIIDPIEKRCITPIPYVQKEIIVQKDKNILVLATKRTIKSEVYQFKNCNTIACPKFVKYIEDNPQKNMDKVIRHYLKKYQDIETIVLGCTHYHLLIPQIKNYIKHPLTFIDSSMLLVNQLKINSEPLQVDLYVTKLTKKIKNNIQIILGDIPYSFIQTNNK